MSVKGIEVCKNGVIVTVDNGWFICDEQDLDIVNEIPWRLGRLNYVFAGTGYEGGRLYSKYGKTSFYFHQQMANKVFGYYTTDIDHLNSVPFDNRDINLNVIGHKANVRKKHSIGYTYRTDCILNKFRVRIMEGSYRTSSHLASEYLALLERRRLEGILYMTEPSHILYNHSISMISRVDLLLSEVRGTITKEDMYHLRLKEVAQNPWYIYRYGLEDECRLHSIKIPDFIEDKAGFMCNKEGIRLCPDLPVGFTREGYF